MSTSGRESNLGSELDKKIPAIRMSVATQQVPALIPLDGIKEPSVDHTRVIPDNQVVTVTDLLLNKVCDTPDAVFIQYPATAKGKDDYVGYTVTDIDRLADEAARQYAKRGLRPDVSNSDISHHHSRLTRTNRCHSLHRTSVRWLLYYHRPISTILRRYSL